MIRITEAIMLVAKRAYEMKLPAPIIETDEYTARLLGDLLCQDLQAPELANGKFDFGVVAMFDGVKIKVRT